MKTFDRPATSAHAPSISTIDIDVKRPKRLWMMVLAVLAVIALVLGSIAFIRARAAAAVTYQTAAVTKGDLVASVTATGTVNPQNTVAVGSQVSGIISEIDADFNTHVKKGQVIARLDPSTFRAALDQAQASLAQSEAQAQAAGATAGGSQNGINTADANARASEASAQAAQATTRMNVAAIATADANVTKAQSAQALAQQTATRDQSLIAQGYIAQSQLDSDRSALIAAQTGVQSAQAAAQQARLQASASASQAAASAAQSAAQQASIGTAQAQAANQAANAAASAAAIGIQRALVKQAQSNVDRTIITSPVDGTIVARSVSVGQTVAASLQTPTLFSIAQDLSKMEVDVAVGEPDIGSVRKGAGVDFTVLAYPNRTFHGTVSQVRINPVTTNNVVTYTTVVLVDNRDGKLLPGMTANAAIHTANAANSLIVPLAALTYTPPQGSVGGSRRRTHRTAPATRASAPPAQTAGGSPWGGSGASGAVPAAGATGRVFVARGTTLTPVRVKIDLVSGAQAAVEPLRGTLGANDAVVTGDSSSANSAKASSSTSTRGLFGATGGPGGRGGAAGGR